MTRQKKNSDKSTFEIGYADLLAELKERIRTAQVRAALSLNQDLVILYWHIGRQISEEMKLRGWGAYVVDKLAQDLRRAFPEMKGFSPRNLRYMRSFAETYSDEQFLQQAVAKIPWGHNVRILDYVKIDTERRWYVEQTFRHGWSREVLILQIESRLYERQGKAITNFEQTLPELQSDLANQVLKDPYSFDFLSLDSEAQERDIEISLVDHIQRFLLELGVGFAFVGRQYHLEIGDQDFYIDLLFYHLKLRCYVVIELKAVEFQPEFAGKTNFYLSAVDDLLRHPDDRPSIGIIICKGKNKVVAEYSLRDTNKPIGVSSFQLTESLPEFLKGNLPSIAQLEEELKG